MYYHTIINLTTRKVHRLNAYVYKDKAAAIRALCEEGYVKKGDKIRYDGVSWKD